jgi:sensor histidine kinase regulating citrate/malate metabolism
MARFFKRFRSFRVQLAAGVALVNAVLMTAFVAGMVVNQQDFLRERTMQRGIRLAQGTADHTVRELMSRDLASMQETVNSLATYPELRYVAVLDTSGRVLAHTDPARLGAHMSDATSLGMLSGEPGTRVLVDDGHLMDIASPVVWQGRTLGWVRFATGMDDPRRQMNKILAEGVAFALLSVVIGVALAVWMARGTTRRLYDLMHVAEATGRGDRAVRPEQPKYGGSPADGTTCGGHHPPTPRARRGTRAAQCASPRIEDDLGRSAGGGAGV